MPFIFFLSILFTQLSHPLSAGILLLIQVTLVSLASGLISRSFWFSYILFLIFLGGMLVLFIYVASLASNEVFQVDLSSIFTNLTLMGLFSLTLPIIDPLFNPTTVTKQRRFIFIKNQDKLIEPSLVYPIYRYPTIILTLFVILYLLLTLIVIVNVTSLSSGPLRNSK